MTWRYGATAPCSASAVCDFDRFRSGGLQDLNSYIVLGSAVVGFLVGTTGKYGNLELTEEVPRGGAAN